MNRTDGIFCHRLGARHGKAGNAEIGNLYGAVSQEHDVLRLDIAVNDLSAVGMLQCLQDLIGKMDGFLYA
ncbi:hypothetical protein SDC9_127681 [bioreactor metagenome]|uniref:Uncharacterized protein n=1 Tax=bioreactor metagenome TaxID=1076179 RepID=A0A645CUQ6_9ZZZZ